MASSHVVNTEVGYAIRMLLAAVPPLRATAQQRSDFQLLKAEVYDLLAATNPALSAQAAHMADAARGEAHLIMSDL